MAKPCCKAGRARPARDAQVKLLPTLCVAALAAGVGAPTLAACGDSLPAKGRQLAQAGGVQLAFAPRAWPLAVGRHFVLEVEVCAPAGSAPSPPLLRVDAEMPAHRHGMNYRASVRPVAAGRYLAEGMMFHMPGRWRFIFDLAAVEGAAPLRITHDLSVE